ncbi:helix-turn-helix transcriptional regulator [Mangrovihabitans endophyticus]|uniref:Helix-turn-helix transcriptional regulator n=1 Tax=Mangrovihabitans endophyticus TaxID=1751298 RepID=A0A8J3BXJ0_9ACTN|nr:response regulator transcription factor [Mangrovihabitans endophyticus]GGK79050.1 helix-turn-helix transcriptional regulator [Mangrovihabitans endophyticus]
MATTCVDTAITKAPGTSPGAIGLSILASPAAADTRLATAMESFLTSVPEIRLTQEGGADCDVVLVLARSLTSEVLGEMSALASAAENPEQCMVLVTAPIREHHLARAIACGVVSILPRHAITPRTMAQAVLASYCGRSILSDHVTRWLIDGARANYALMRSEFGLMPGGLTVRETEVLRLLSEGEDTAEIAERLHYSERTIKKIIQDLTSRLNLRNRAHAVSYALRAGAI